MARVRRISPAPPDAFLVIDGRKWRRSDPHIPPALRQELVNELMAARRAVGAATDGPRRSAARRRVNDAKVALGERGRAWWLDVVAAELEARIAAAIRALLRSRRGHDTIRPSEPARIVDGRSWRRRMTAVREQALRMVACGELTIVSSGSPVRGSATRGMRYRLTTPDA